MRAKTGTLTKAALARCENVLARYDVSLRRKTSSVRYRRDGLRLRWLNG
jgi:hypothetical protein